MGYTSNISNTTILEGLTSAVCSYNQYNTTSFYDSSYEGKSKAVEAIYELGYITYDEANQLLDYGCAQRNEFTVIYMKELPNSFLFWGIERVSESTELFYISYDKQTGSITK